MQRSELRYFYQMLHGHIQYYLYEGKKLIAYDTVARRMYQLDKLSNTYKPVSAASDDILNSQSVMLVSQADERAIRTALAIAATLAHKNQKDKGGNPYIYHPIAVSNMVDGGNAVDCQIVAFLHDVVEDTNIHLNDLRDIGFSETAAMSIDAITRRNEESYEAYMERVKQNDTASRVKLADLKNNSDLSRLRRAPTQTDIQKVKKYQHYIVELEQMLLTSK